MSPDTDAARLSRMRAALDEALKLAGDLADTSITIATRTTLEHLSDHLRDGMAMLPADTRDGGGPIKDTRQRGLFA